MEAAWEPFPPSTAAQVTQADRIGGCCLQKACGSLKALDLLWGQEEVATMSPLAFSMGHWWSYMIFLFDGFGILGGFGGFFVRVFPK